MDQTEKYLNGILNKRLGSVINQSAFAKNATTVARLPLQEQPVQKMPTVFRKKYETVLLQQESVARESKMAQILESKTDSTEKDPVENHRVEYMAISKRISMKRNDEFISPTVDIGKYQTKLIKRSSSPDLRLEQDKGQQKGENIRNSQGQIKQGTKPRRRKIFS